MRRLVAALFVCLAIDARAQTTDHGPTFYALEAEATRVITWFADSYAITERGAGPAPADAVVRSSLVGGARDRRLRGGGRGPPRDVAREARQGARRHRAGGGARSDTPRGPTRSCGNCGWTSGPARRAGATGAPELATPRRRVAHERRGRRAAGSGRTLDRGHRRGGHRHRVRRVDGGRLARCTRRGRRRAVAPPAARSPRGCSTQAAGSSGGCAGSRRSAC